MESKMAALVPKSTGLTSKQLYRVAKFFDDIGTSQTIPPSLNTKDSYSNFIRTLLKPDHIKRGRLSCLLSVTAPFTITPKIYELQDAYISGLLGRGHVDRETGLGPECGFWIGTTDPCGSSAVDNNTTARWFGIGEEVGVRITIDDQIHVFQDHLRAFEENDSKFSKDYVLPYDKLHSSWSNFAKISSNKAENIVSKEVSELVAGFFLKELDFTPAFQRAVMAEGSMRTSFLGFSRWIKSSVTESPA
ncbi:hypothetical protein RJ639_031632 [Escallonia herrerae]|uniref:Uncharacterized protein n=1 Tax=Escallonia herrerae TaxID=1293975 RepID=A0AA88X775_9ASTE|nr:hypothetical protein RJ639_031632 [Escallonia herrerae]